MSLMGSMCLMGDEPYGPMGNKPNESYKTYKPYGGVPLGGRSEKECECGFVAGVGVVLGALEAVGPDFLAVALFGDDGEAEASEEVGTDGEGEELAGVEGAGVVDDGVEEARAESLSGEVVVDDE